LPNLFRAAPDVVWNSFAYAAGAATLGLAAGMLGARFRIARAAWLLFFIPGILLGRSLIAALNGTVIYGTATLVIFAFALRYFAIAWEGAASARRAMDRDLTDAARLSGARGWTLFRHVQLPQTAPSLAATWYVIYLLCLWDVETLVLIQPPGGETLALRAFNLLHYGHHAQANALCVTLLALALAPLGAWLCLRPLIRRA
jgi:iron(III) transport system permease protein